MDKNRDKMLDVFKRRNRYSCIKNTNTCPWEKRLSLINDVLEAIYR